ncbi:MAG: hypothetical protein QOE21_533, partial [Microbacteriaceae bacterium]|nr:hypothetical protein [Microbacteriaceae bacterium]
IAVIGSVLFGTLTIPKPVSTGRPTAAEIATSVGIGFSHSAAVALAVSAAFALVAFLLVFTLPKKIDRGYGE